VMNSSSEPKFRETLIVVAISGAAPY
jgi:hypothetical protein